MLKTTPVGFADWLKYEKDEYLANPDQFIASHPERFKQTVVKDPKPKKRSYNPKVITLRKDQQCGYGSCLHEVNVECDWGGYYDRTIQAGDKAIVIPDFGKRFYYHVDCFNHIRDHRDVIDVGLTLPGSYGSKR